jgi:carbamoyl-phosphate synthase large subunit
MNVQYAIHNGTVYVLEVNPRASRTVPFVSKATGVPLAKLAARLMIGRKLKEFNLPSELKVFAVLREVSGFPFSRFPGVDTFLVLK